jgi:hypothetical protein
MADGLRDAWQPPGGKDNHPRELFEFGDNLSDLRLRPACLIDTHGRDLGVVVAETRRSGGVRLICEHEQCSRSSMKPLFINEE